MKNTVALTALNTEVLTDEVAGFGNFAGYVSLKEMVAGQVVRVNQYIDVETEGDNALVDSVDISFDDLQIANTEGAVEIPFTLEANQTASVGFTLLQGAAPLNVGWRITNVITGE